ncbi:MAG: hypothetical protein ACOCZ5_02965 [bacterium]
MKYFSMALIYLGFFTLITFATWYTKSAWCLWALVLAPDLGRWFE